MFTDLSAMHLAVFAPGLLGGSILHDARALGCRNLRVWARREAALEETRDLKLADMTSTDAAEVATGADLLILCPPVEAMPGLAAQICQGRPAAGAIVTDVGSVKAMVMEQVAPVFAQAGLTFIGSHPMAGGSKGGLAEARRGLFQDAACILTPGGDPQEAANDKALRRLEAFWTALGARCTVMDPALHDQVVARVSHLPHMAAVLTTLAAFQPEPSWADYSAGGLRDTTRVAGGDPGMWRGILLNTKSAVRSALQDFLREGQDLLTLLENDDATGIEQLLTKARDLHATRYR